MNHHHLATVVKFQATHETVKSQNPIFNCLFEINTLGNLNPMEKFLILSVDGKFEDTEPTEYIITDFHYKEDELHIIRCKVLCPIVTQNRSSKTKGVADVVYWMEVSPYKKGILTPSLTCSPENYAYTKIGQLYSAFKYDGNDYVPMYCFSDGNESMLNSYLAFCKVKSLDDINREWIHHDQLHFSKNDEDLYFLCHQLACPY
ncbi:MAG: hypothetical protein IPO37_20600 [Saprospiraceae bacterium]|jgi:hypothetical protein|nr:hypothetical protein [Saprospiraceae bacterium]